MSYEKILVVLLSVILFATLLGVVLPFIMYHKDEEFIRDEEFREKAKRDNVPML